MNDERLRQSLIEIMDKGLLNNFVNGIFDYNFNDDEYVYIQYKIVNNNIVLNIYDNAHDNRFNAYIFTKNNIISEDNIHYINLKDCYQKYINGNYNSKIDLLGALILEKDNNEIIKIINLLFDNEIKDILLKHFTV